MNPHTQFMSFTVLLLYIIAVPLFFSEQTISAVDLVVTSEDDSGTGTLRNAIDTINSGTDVQNKITFDFNVTTIKVLTPLPAITNSVVIDGFETTMIDCTMLSPIEQPEQFSATISVTIDGSNMTPNEGDFTDGLLICAGEVTIRGLRIQNIRTGTINVFSNRASAIRVETTELVTIECCEITAIQGISSQNNTQSGSVVGIQGEDTSIIRKCYVHDLVSGPLIVTTTGGQTGSVKGIARFQQASDCFVTNLQTGSIFGDNTQSVSASLNTGQLEGVTTEPLQPSPCINEKCVCEVIDCNGSSTICIQSCLVTCCQTGSITANTEEATTIGSCKGIEVDSRDSTLLLEDCTVCNLCTGNAEVTLNNTEFTLETVTGISCRELSNACAQRNTVKYIQQGSTLLDGINSSVRLGSPGGMFIQAIQVIASENQIDTVQCGTATLTGTCIQVSDDPLQADSGDVVQFCQNQLINQIDLSLLSTCSSGLVVAATEPTVCNNTTQRITGGKRIDEGINNQVFSFSSIGIIVTSNPDEGSQQLLPSSLIAHNNTVQNIFGPNLLARTNSSFIRALSPSKGMYLISFLTAIPRIFACGNTIDTVCEGTITAAYGAQAGYGFLVPFAPVNNPLLFVPQETAGILFRFVQIPFLPIGTGQIIAEDNTVRTIVGGTIQNGTLKTGTLAVGLSFNPQLFTPPNGNKHQRCTSKVFETRNCDGTVDTSLVRRNSICNVWAGTNNHAYGIFVNNMSHIINNINSNFGTNNTAVIPPFSIDDNTINNIHGLGSPESFTLSLENTITCIGTTDGLPNESVYLPFPYEPTSGIYMLSGNCSTLSYNTISHIKEKNAQARGITTAASSDMCLNGNSISSITGYGIFVGGAQTSLDFVNDTSGLLTTEEFENLFASTRNKIHTNSIFDTTNDGIKLGVINWDNYFETSQENCGTSNTLLPIRNKEVTKALVDDSVLFVGNHGQVAPTIEKVSINRNTVTVDIKLQDPSHIFTNFIIQFFASSTNSVPHGEHPISAFDDPQFIITTNINGTVVQRFTFVPTHSVNKTDIISAHVTVAEQQQTFVTIQDRGDTSEFTQQQKNTAPYPIACHTQQKPYSFIGQLCG